MGYPVIDKLREMCAESIAFNEKHGLTREPEIAVKLFGRKARGSRVRLFPKGGPYGETVGVQEDMTIGMFKVADVLKFCDKADVAAPATRPAATGEEGAG